MAIFACKKGRITLTMRKARSNCFCHVNVSLPEWCEVLERWHSYRNGYFYLRCQKRQLDSSMRGYILIFNRNFRMLRSIAPSSDKGNVENDEGEQHEGRWMYRKWCSFRWNTFELLSVQLFERDEDGNDQMAAIAFEPMWTWSKYQFAKIQCIFKTDCYCWLNFRVKKLARNVVDSRDAQYSQES